MTNPASPNEKLRDYGHNSLIEVEYLARNIEIEADGCWRWTGEIEPKGYGKVYLGGPKYRSGLAHRYAYTLIRGPIPDGLVSDHLCRHRYCVNPYHIELVTNKVNVLRGIGTSAVHARQTHCKNGHPLSGPNLHVKPDGSRVCRICRRKNNMRHNRNRPLKVKQVAWHNTYLRRKERAINIAKEN